MSNSSVRALVKSIAANLGTDGELVGGTSGNDVEFSLFNGPNSICSQKARAILAYHGVPYTSHSMNMFVGQTYMPDYVRLRMIGCRSAGLPLVSRHSGSGSVKRSGCDPAVVPTLVDWRTDSVVVDSLHICQFIDALFPDEERLIPRHLAGQIERELEIVDQLPNYQMLMGLPPGEDTRPAARRGDDGTAFAMSKVKRCDTALAEHEEDPELVEAYSAKREKEYMAATHHLAPEGMRAAYDTAQREIDELDGRLSQSQERFLFGSDPTMADIFWGIELLRMENLGAVGLWRDGSHERVEAYLGTIRTLPALRLSVTDWPGSQH